MKNILKAGLLSLIFFTSCKTTPYEVLHVSKEPAQAVENGGSFYALPRQSLVVNLVVQKNEFIAGPCSEYAERSLGLKDVIKKDSISYEVVDVTFESRTEADPRQFYFISYNDDKIRINYDQNLIIKSLNAKTVKNSIFSKKQKPNSKVQSPDKSCCNFKEDPKIYENQWDEFNSKLTKGNSRATLMEAMDIIQLINKTKEDRQKLMSSYYEINYDGSALKYLNEDFNKTEDDCLKLFKGLRRTSYESFRFEITPENIEETDYIIAYFSTEKGIRTELNIQESINGGESSPISIKFEITDYSPFIHSFNQNSQQNNKGLFFRLPVNTTVKASLKGQELHSAQLNFSQFGAVQSLPVLNGRFSFSPCTGELISIE